MDRLPFNLDLLQFLVDHRSAALTHFFQLATFMGEVEGYVLVVTFVYVACDKRLAVRMAILVLVTMSLNHLLKIFIANARPFVTEGTYEQKWAVTAEKARELVTEYSTPSGHAMSAAVFYSLLYAAVKNRWVRVGAVAAIVLTGLSRPYLGVHYLEDVIIGWAIGLLFILFLLQHGQRIEELWDRRPYAQQVAIAIASSAALWIGTIMCNGGRIDEQPLAFIGYAGFLAGIVVGYPLERRIVNFEPRSGTMWQKALRFGLSVALVIATLSVLDTIFEWLSDDHSAFGHLLRYIRYIAAAMAGIFVAPLLFTRLKLATTAVQHTIMIRSA